MSLKNTSHWIAVTGASGFIGKVLVQQLLNQGYFVRVLTRQEKLFTASEQLQVFLGDLTTTKNWAPFLEGVEVLIHCAAELKQKSLMYDVNVVGANHLLQASIGRIRRWVQLSSVGAYGPVQSGVITEESLENPVGDYEVTKTVFDNILRDAGRNEGLEVALLRPSNVFGENMPNQSLFQMMGMIRKGFFFYVGKNASANYVHVNDVAQALILCAIHPNASGKTFNLSDWCTMRQMVSAMAHTMQVPEPKIALSPVVARFIAKLLKGVPGFPLTESRVRALSNTSRYSSLLIKNELNYEIKFPIELGVQQLMLK